MGRPTLLELIDACDTVLPTLSPHAHGVLDEQDLERVLTKVIHGIVVSKLPMSSGEAATKIQAKWRGPGEEEAPSPPR